MVKRRNGANLKCVIQLTQQCCTSKVDSGSNNMTVTDCSSSQKTQLAQSIAPREFTKNAIKASCFHSIYSSAQGPVAYTQKKAARTSNGTFRHNQSWMEATVIPPSGIVFAVQQETAKQTQPPAWSKAAKLTMPEANNLYNEAVMKHN